MDYQETFANGYISALLDIEKTVQVLIDDNKYLTKKDILLRINKDINSFKNYWIKKVSEDFKTFHKEELHADTDKTN